MDKTLRYLIEFMDREFHGPSMNGPGLLPTLRTLNASQAASHRTFDGYSAWEIAVHLANYRMVILRDLGKSSPFEPYRWRMSDFSPMIPERDVSVPAWSSCLDYLTELHNGLIAALKSKDLPAMSEMMPTWNIPWGEAIVWLSSHDTFHTAQLRSMGTPGIQPEKPKY